jgi:hypothetical protein
VAVLEVQTSVDPKKLRTIPLSFELPASAIGAQTETWSW